MVNCVNGGQGFLEILSQEDGVLCATYLSVVYMHYVMVIIITMLVHTEAHVLRNGMRYPDSSPPELVS